MSNKRISMNRYKGVYTYETKDNDKSYSITYKNLDGKKIWETIGLHSNGIRGAYCESIRSKRINSLRLGEDVEKVKIGRRKNANIKTFNMIFDYYIEKKKMKEKSKKGFEGKWKKYIRGTIGNKNIKDISVYDIIKLREKWELTQSSKDIIIGLIGTSIRFAKVHNVEFKDISNPVELIKDIDNIILSKEEKKKEKRNIRDRYLEICEISELKESLKDDFQMLLAVELMLSTGARISGVLTIKKKDINFKNNRIRIIDHKAAGEVYYGFMTPSLKQILEKYLPTIKSNSCIINKNENPIPYRTTARKIQNQMNQLFNTDLDTKDTSNRVVLHTLRHTFASHLAINGTPMASIKKLLNHKDIAMTMRYAKLSPDCGNSEVLELYK